LPLKGAVVFPFIIVPLSIHREASARAVDRALAEHRTTRLVAKRDDDTDQPAAEDLHTVGTAATILRMLKLPDDSVRILVQGAARVRVHRYGQTEAGLQAHVETLEEAGPGPEPRGLRQEALMRSVKQNLEKVAQLGRTISPEVLLIAANLEDPGRLADLVTSNLEVQLEDAQA